MAYRTDRASWNRVTPGRDALVRCVSAGIGAVTDGHGAMRTPAASDFLLR